MGRPKAPLTDRDFETLGEMISAWLGASRYHSPPEYVGVAPIDFGGSNGSHHSLTATKLVKHGMAEHRKRGQHWGQASTRFRGSKQYRPTEAGRKAFADWKAAKASVSVSSPNID